MLQALRRQPDNRRGSAKHYWVATGLTQHFPKPFYPVENEDCDGEIPASRGGGVNSFKGLNGYGSNSIAIVRRKNCWDYQFLALYSQNTLEASQLPYGSTDTYNNMITQNIQSYRDTRNTDTSLCSCTHTKVALEPETKGTGANSASKSPSSRGHVHKFTVNIRPLERLFMCCFHTGHRSRRSQPLRWDTSMQMNHLRVQWRHLCKPSPPGTFFRSALLTSSYHLMLPPSCSSTKSCLWATWKAILLDRAKLCWDDWR